MMLQRDLPWHGAAWDALRALHARGVHAMLLHGLRGIGKTSLGFEFAQALLCEQRTDGGRACRRCPGCLMMEAGSHPDFRFVVPEAMADLKPGRRAEDEEGEGEADAIGETAEPSEPKTAEGKSKRASRELKIDQVRALGAWATIATHRGGMRVALLAPAEAMNAAAANAVLKLLEEPPPATVLVLVSDALDDVIPTIRSRSVLVRVERPAPEAAVAWLTEQGVGDPEAALAFAGGAPIAALDEATTAAQGASVRAVLLELLGQMPVVTPAEIAQRIPRDIALAPALGVIQRWCIDLLMVRAAGRVQYHPRQFQSIARLAARADEGRLWRWLRSLTGLQSVRDHPLNARLVIEAVMLDYRATLSEQR